jgi:hypothetical protein
MNRCRAPAPEDARAGVGVLDGLDVGDADEALKRTMRDTALAALDWEEVQENAIARLERQTEIRVQRMPFLVREEFGLREATELVDIIRRARSPGTNGSTAPGDEA